MMPGEAPLHQEERVYVIALCACIPTRKSDITSSRYEVATVSGFEGPRTRYLYMHNSCSIRSKRHLYKNSIDESHYSSWTYKTPSLFL